MDFDYAPLPSVLASFIGGFLCPDHRSKGLVMGWGLVLEDMVRQVHMGVLYVSPPLQRASPGGVSRIQ